MPCTKSLVAKNASRMDNKLQPSISLIWTNKKKLTAKNKKRLIIGPNKFFWLKK